MFVGGPSKKKLRRFYAHRAGYYKYDISYYRKEMYYHMDLQAQGVKYKSRSSDTTYHGRKAIHAICRINYAIEHYFECLDRLEELYS